MLSTTTNPPFSTLNPTATCELRDIPPSPAEWDGIRESMVPEFQFLTCNWIEPWSEHLIEEGWDGPVDYFVSHDGHGQLAAAIPFARQTKASFRFRSLAGLYVPLRGLPIAQAAINTTTAQLAEFLTNHHDGMGLRLAPIPEADPALRPLIDSLERRGWRTTSTHVGYRQIVSLPKTFEEYEAARKGSRWKTIGKRERKAARDHDMRLTLYTTEDCDDWTPVIRNLGKIERKSWLPERGGDMWFVGEDQVRFWTEVFNAQRRGLAARIWILYFNDQPVTFDFNLDSGRCRYSIAGHYVKDVYSYGTGSILMKHMIQDAVSRRIEKIDMGTGNSGYKTYWGAEMADPIVDWTAFPPGVRGTMMYGAAGLVRAGRTVKTGFQTLKAKLRSDE